MEAANDASERDEHENEEAHDGQLVLLQAMEGVVDRRAHYYCVLVLVRHADDPQPLIAEGEWHGEIAQQMLGEGGFGYDPLFWLPQLNKMSAELSRDEKAQISHRAQALHILLQRLQIAAY